MREAGIPLARLRGIERDGSACEEGAKRMDDQKWEAFKKANARQREIARAIERAQDCQQGCRNLQEHDDNCKVNPSARVQVR